MSTTNQASTTPPPLSRRSRNEWLRRQQELAVITNPFTVWQLKRELEQIERRAAEGS